MWYRILAVVGALLLVCARSVGASETSKQLWADYNPSIAISEKVDLFGDIGGRAEFEDKRWWRLVVRPGVRIPVSQFLITAGIGNFFTFNDVIADRWEIRPFQGASVVWPDRRIALDHYVRLEQRFDFNMDTWESLNSLRARYRLRVTYRFAAIAEDRYWTLTSSGEVFYTLAGEQGQQREEIRVTAGVERNFSHQRRIRFEISWQQESLYFDPNKNIRDIYFRLRFYRQW